jgi:hypothetical protein
MNKPITLTDRAQIWEPKKIDFAIFELLQDFILITKDQLQIENKTLFLFTYEKERQISPARPTTGAARERCGPRAGKPAGALVITQISPRAICY